MDTYPYARNEEEAAYYQRMHYLSSALLVYGAGDEALQALSDVWRRVMERGIDHGVSSNIRHESQPS